MTQEQIDSLAIKAYMSTLGRVIRLARQEGLDVQQGYHRPECTAWLKANSLAQRAIAQAYALPDAMNDDAPELLAMRWKAFIDSIPTPRP
jgi:hypothetical protein